MKDLTPKDLEKLELRLRIVNNKLYMAKLKTKKLSRERQLLQKKIDYHNKKNSLKRINEEN